MEAAIDAGPPPMKTVPLAIRSPALYFFPQPPPPGVSMLSVSPVCTMNRAFATAVPRNCRTFPLCKP
jgi:hypothetical protein